MSVEAKPVIECDTELYIKLATHLQHSITGKPVYYSDTLADLIRRHCPDIYAMASEEGYSFQPVSEAEDLEQSPPHVRFNVVRRVLN